MSRQTERDAKSRQLKPEEQSKAARFLFKIEDDLNTENSRKKWLEWKRRTDPGHYLDPKKRAEAGQRAALATVGLATELSFHLGVLLGFLAISASGELARGGVQQRIDPTA